MLVDTITHEYDSSRPRTSLGGRIRRKWRIAQGSPQSQGSQNGYWTDRGQVTCGHRPPDTRGSATRRVGEDTPLDQRQQRLQPARCRSRDPAESPSSLRDRQEDDTQHTPGSRSADPRGSKTVGCRSTAARSRYASTAASLLAASGNRVFLWPRNEHDILRACVEHRDADTGRGRTPMRLPAGLLRSLTGRRRNGKAGWLTRAQLC